MRAAIAWRIALTLAAIVAVETIVCAAAALPLVALWLWAAAWIAAARPAIVIVSVSLALVPTYALFAIAIIPWSALATRITNARTPSDTEMRIADYDWMLMRWVRYMAATHVVRVVAGPLYCGSPIWTWHLRLNGARVGRRVYVNTVYISDHNLLEVGDDVVIGADVHISGHTVEHGIVRTGRVRLGRGAMVGLATLVDIDTEIGDRCQVGALSVVPKHARLEGDATYAGIPVARLK